jgi:hypothetical protein
MASPARSADGRVFLLGNFQFSRYSHYFMKCQKQMIERTTQRAMTVASAAAIAAAAARSDLEFGIWNLVIR